MSGDKVNKKLFSMSLRISFMMVLKTARVFGWTKRHDEVFKVTCVLKAGFHSAPSLFWTR